MRLSPFLNTEQTFACFQSCGNLFNRWFLSVGNFDGGFDKFCTFCLFFVCFLDCCLIGLYLAIPCILTCIRNDWNKKSYLYILSDLLVRHFLLYCYKYYYNIKKHYCILKNSQFITLVQKYFSSFWIILKLLPAEFLQYIKILCWIFFA